MRRGFNLRHVEMTSHLGSALLALSIAAAATWPLVAGQLLPDRESWWQFLVFELVQAALVGLLIWQLVG